MGAVVGLLIGAAVAGISVAVANSQKNADEAAEEQARIMKQYTTEITEFSSAMSYKMNESLSSQYELISDTIENSNYSEATLSAIRDMYSTVIAIFENPEISKLAKNIENKLGSEGKDFLTNIATALEGLGESSLQQALQTVSDSLNKGASAVEAASQLYIDIADKDSVYFKEQEAKWIEDRDAEIKNIKSILDHKKTLKAYAKQADVSVEAYKKQLQEQIGELEGATYEFSEERQALLDKTFSLITSDSSVLSLQQSLTGLESAKKNLIEIDKALNEGTLSLEQMTELATTLGEDFYKVLNTEGLQGLRTLITNELVGPYDDYLKQIDNFILGQESKLAAAIKEGEEEAANALRQNIELIKAYRKEYMTFNKTSLESYMNEKKLAVLEKEADKKNIRAMKEIISLKKKEYDTEEDRLKQYFKDYPKELELIKKIRSGVINIEEAWVEVADKENFKRLLENTESYFEDLEEAQEELVKSYKSILQAEQEALKNSLDKRKELYEKYFDTIDRESEEEDFKEEQRRLQNAIANLSTATDANSLSKLKEYQEELMDLEKDFLDTQTEKQREDLLTTLDNQSESLDQYYEERLNNEKAL